MTSRSVRALIFVPILLSLLLVTSTSGSQSRSISVSSFGTINYSGFNFVDFEIDDNFKWGIDGKNEYMLYGTRYDGTPPNWTRGGYGPSRHPSVMLFEPETSLVHEGLQSAKISVIDTSSEETRRIEILHDWNPNTEYIWQSAWYYFPSSLNPLDSWTTFHRIIYERMWDPNKAVYFQNFQISLSVFTDKRSATNGQQIFVLSLGKGTVDNNNNGDDMDEIWPYYSAELYSNRDASLNVPSSWLTKQSGFQVPFDQWFEVTTLVCRNLADYNNGYVKVWINGELIWDVQGTRTVGIAPNVLDSIDPTPPEPQGFLSSGFGCYTDIGTRSKTIYVDDMLITNSSALQGF